MNLNMQEIGFDGLIAMRKKLKFGDIVENGWASERNPLRFGIVVKIKEGSIALTNGEGKYWDLAFDRETKLQIVGSALNPAWQEVIENS